MRAFHGQTPGELPGMRRPQRNLPQRVRCHLPEVRYITYKRLDFRASNTELRWGGQPEEASPTLWNCRGVPRERIAKKKNPQNHLTGQSSLDFHYFSSNLAPTSLVVKSPKTIFPSPCPSPRGTQNRAQGVGMEGKEKKRRCQPCVLPTLQASEPGKKGNFKLDESMKVLHQTGLGLFITLSAKPTSCGVFLSFLTFVLYTKR